LAALSGKCELYSESLGKRGLDPLPNYTPPHEDPRTRPDLAAKYPLQLLSPPAPEFLKLDVRQHRFAAPKAGVPTLEIHPLDAAPRGIINGQWLRIFNDRGSFQARAIVAETVKRASWSRRVSGGTVIPRRRQLQYDDEHRADRFSAAGQRSSTIWCRWSAFDSFSARRLPRDRVAIGGR